LGTGKFRIVLLFLFLLLGCGSPEAKKVVFSVGGAPQELAGWEDLLRDFERVSGIGVELQRQPADTDRQRQGLMIAMKAGMPNPDVFLMDVTWLPLFARSGWLFWRSPFTWTGDSSFTGRISWSGSVCAPPKLSQSFLLPRGHCRRG
jgi:ABC-type glycerol-3-phosphate transport system substrate-binding protein